MRYHFANCELDTDRHILTRDGDPVPVEPQVFDLIHLLVRNPGILVTRDQILEEIWDGRIVSESSISARTNAARKAVGDTGKSQNVIKTVVRRGLQLVVSVSTIDATKPKPPSPAELRQRVRFATSQDGTKIAYATSGVGPKILRSGHFLTHLEMDLDSTIWRPLLSALSAEHTLIRYDQRGTGLSDTGIKDADLDSQVADLKAVADASQAQRFPLIALSQGVPIAIKFAARYPERVSCLVLYGGYSEGRMLREDSPQNAAADAMIALIREGWGKPESAFMGAFTSLFCPGASRAELSELVKMQLASASPANAIRLRAAIDQFSVFDALSKIQVPTLVVHGRNDSVHPMSEGNKLASQIPNAELIVLETSNHILLPNEPANEIWIAEALAFLKRHHQP